MARVLIADDHELVRAGIRRLLEDLTHEVIGEASCGEDALEFSRHYAPDIAFLDIHMPGMGGLEATQRIRRHLPDCRIIILTAHLDGPMPRTLLEAGVDGFLTKGSSITEMQRAIAQVLRGRRYLSQEVAQKLALASVEGTTGSPFDRLTQRELQVAMRLLGGETNRQIAEDLNISPKTVTTYRQRILNKTATRGMPELLRLAIQYDLIAAGPAPAEETE